MDDGTMAWTTITSDKPGHPPPVAVAIDVVSYLADFAPEVAAAEWAEQLGRSASRVLRQYLDKAHADAMQAQIKD